MAAGDEFWPRRPTGRGRRSRTTVKAIATTIILALACAGCAPTQTPLSRARLLTPLRPYVNRIAHEPHKVPADRKALLDRIAATVALRLRRGEDAPLTFICSQNSRRSHMSQIWAQTAAYCYGLDRVPAFSGGTQPTACNCRTVTALQSVGFDFAEISGGDNPVYLVRYAEDRPPIRVYSKPYNADGNPKTNFIALMTCSQADKKCPVVEGAIARYAIHYIDPKLCDDTPEETQAYNERCREIAREMFYLMSQVRRRLEIATNPRAPDHSANAHSPRDRGAP
jgi:arsenate reductase